MQSKRHIKKLHTITRQVADAASQPFVSEGQILSATGNTGGRNLKYHLVIKRPPAGAQLC